MVSSGIRWPLIPHRSLLLLCCLSVVVVVEESVVCDPLRTLLDVIVDCGLWFVEESVRFSRPT